MGLMGLLLKVAAECFDVLAWPLFALGYPLCASIQAIETNSNLDTQKLNTYWVCLSLILMFERAFGKLLEWLPYWPSTKLIIVGCLIIPYFDGSFYVYRHIVRPCLSLNPHNVINWFIKLKEFLNQDNILVEVKTEAKETRPDASDNLFALDSLPAFKQKLKETNVAKEEINVVATMEKKEVTSTTQVKQIEPEFGLSGNRTCGSLEVKEMTDAMLAGRDFDILPSKNIRKEWTCAICEFTAASEADFISHLHGNLHKGLNATSKHENQTSVKTDVNMGNKDMSTGMMTDGGSADRQHATNMQKLWICAVCQETATSETDFILHLQGRQHENAFEKLNPENQLPSAKFPASVKTSVLLDSKDMGTATITSREIPDKQHPKGVQICSVRQETAANVTDFILHLQGKQHVDACGRLKTKEQPLKNNVSLASAATSAPPESGYALPDKPQSNNSQPPWTCAVCDVTSTSKMDLISHFQGTRHKHALDLLKVKIETSRNNTSPEKRETTGSNLSGELRSKNFQKPWTCGICHVTVTGEATVVSHLQGRKHLNACKKPEVPTQTSKRASSPASMGHKSDSCEEAEKHESGIVSSQTRRKEGKETTNNEAPENNPQYTTVYVGNLAPEVTQLDLHHHIHALGAGVIEEVRVQRDKGFGFVRFSTHAEAALAIQLGNTESILYGKRIKCSWGSKPTPPRTSSNPLPPPAAAPLPGLSATDLLIYERQLAMGKMSGVHALMHPWDSTLKQAAMGMGAAGASQGIYDGRFQNVAAAQQLMYYQ